MNKLKIFLLLIPLTLNASLDGRRQKILNLITKELAEIVRLVNQTKGRSPDLILRMAELHFERARLQKEVENAAFLKLPVKQRQRINKRQFFAKSNKSYKNAQKSAKFLLKRYPNYPKRGEVYNILGKNSLEFQSGKSAAKYFSLAAKNASGNVELQKDASKSLAEDKYNKKRYRQAIPLYEKSLRGKKTRWWPKDAYNLAWCYFRIKNYSKAISLMEQIHSMGGKRDYIDMRGTVERDIAYFYVKAGRVDSAVAFYKRIGANLADKFISVAKYLEKDGKSADAIKILKEALKFNPSSKQEVKIYTALLNLYETYGRYTSHLNACQKLFALNKTRDLSSDSREMLIYQSKLLSNKLQKQVNAKTYKGRPKIRKAKAFMAVKYFNMLKVLEPKEGGKWNLVAGDTYYAVGLYEQAIPYYNQAYKIADDNRDKKMAKTSMNNILVALGKPKIKKSTKNRYTLPVYNYFLENEPRSKKSYKIYQRAFDIYFTKRQMDKAEEMLVGFSKNFPTAKSKQEAMIAKIIEYYKKRKNYGEVERWAKRVADGEFNVSSNYNKKVRLTFVSTKLEKVQKAQGKGAKKEVLEGYMEIYNNKLAGRGSRVTAGYNIATIFYELGDSERNYEWANKSLNMMGPKTKLKYSSSFMAMGNDFLNRREFAKATTVYKKLLNGICKSKSRYRKELYQTIYTLELAQKKVTSARSSIGRYVKCGIRISDYNNSRFDVLMEMARNKSWREFNSYMMVLEKVPSLGPKLIIPLDNLRAYYLDMGMRGQANNVKARILKLYKKNRKRKFPAQALDIVANFEMTNLNRAAANLKRTRLKFPEKVFQITMQKKFKALENVKRKARSMFAIGSASGKIQTRKVLVLAHEAFSLEVANFTPPGKNKKYVTFFKRDMRGVINPLKAEARKQRKLAKAEILKNQVFSNDNNFFVGKNPKGLDLEYHFPKESIPMDRGGGR